MGVRWLMVAVLGMALAGPALAQPPAPSAPPMVKPEGLKQVSPHVQVIPDNSTPLVPNVGFVVGTRGVLVVDTGLGPANGKIVADTAARIAPGRKIYLVATHAHPEHELGAQAFPAGIVMIRSNDQVADVAQQGDRLARTFASRSPAIAELLKDAVPRKADLTFDKSHDLDLGGVTARILALGPNHTAGDTAVWVAADQVLFSGDVAMRAMPSIMATTATPATWARSLAAFEALKPAVVVPSHGPLGDVGYVTGYRDYLKEVGERTAAAKKAGATLEAATAQVTEAMAARYPDRNRLSGAVRISYAAAT